MNKHKSHWSDMGIEHTGVVTNIPTKEEVKKVLMGYFNNNYQFDTFNVVREALVDIYKELDIESQSSGMI